MSSAFSRRNVLQGLATAGLLGGLPVPGLSRLGFAATPAARPILVVLHLRGGCDGLNLISPADDPAFVAARVSDLRVLADGPTPGFGLKNPPDPFTDFRLHAAAGGLHDLYAAGNLAFIHACGLTNATRSHFVATDMIEHGVAGEADLARTGSGWISRALANGGTPPQGAVRAIAASGTVAGDLAEWPSAMAIPDLNNGLSMVGGPQVANVLWQLYANQEGGIGDAGRASLQMCAEVDMRVPRDPQGHVVPYQPEADAAYDGAADFARALKTVAQLIKMDIGLETVTLDYGDWDTHEGQPGRFRNQVDRLSHGLAAFWNDIPAYHDRVTLVSLTEFGRRLRSNKSNGTDHGRASVMMVLGGRVAGGQMFGKWPGLKAEQLDEGVDLAVTTDYRQVLSEVLGHHYGKIEKSCFPGYAYSKPLGLFV